VPHSQVPVGHLRYLAVFALLQHASEAPVDDPHTKPWLRTITQLPTAWIPAFDTNVVITSIAGAAISASIDILAIGFPQK
jgi:hypothetical protein